MKPGAPSLRDTLLAEPWRFEFDAAVAVMMRAAGTAEAGNAIGFETRPGLAFVASDIDAVSQHGSRFRAVTGLLGLTGPAGVLPRFYTELVNTERRRRSPGLAAFLDLLAQRSLAQFAQAGIKYRAAHAAAAAASGAADEKSPPRDDLRLALLALGGHAPPELAARLPQNGAPLLFHAGAFAMRPRSADRLAAMLGDWLGAPVQVEQFAGHWARLAPAERTALPARGRAAQFNRLGVDAAAGRRCWDIGSRVVLRVGPLDRAGFERLMPGGKRLEQLQALARLYLEGEIGFSVLPVLAARAVPPLSLARRRTPATGRAPQLGWNSWLPVRAGRTRDAADMAFNEDRQPSQWS